MPRSLLNALTLLLALLTLTACTPNAGTDPTTDSEGQHTSDTEPQIDLAQAIPNYVATAKWTVASGKPQAWVTDGEMVWMGIAPNGFQHLVAFDTASGTVKHSLSLGGEPLSVAICGAKVWVSTKRGWLYAFDKESGKQTDQLYLTSNAYGLQVTEECAYYITNKGAFCFTFATRKTEAFSETGFATCILNEAEQRLYCVKEGRVEIFDTKTLTQVSELKSETLTAPTMSRAILQNGILYFGTCRVDVKTMTAEALPFLGQVLDLRGDMIVTTKGVFDLRTNQEVRALLFSLAGYNKTAAALTPAGRLFVWNDGFVDLLYTAPENYTEPTAEKVLSTRNDNVTLPDNPFAAYRNRRTHELGLRSINTYQIKGQTIYALGYSFSDNHTAPDVPKLFRLDLAGNVTKEVVLPNNGAGFNLTDTELQVAIPAEKAILIYNLSDLSLARRIDLPSAATHFVLDGDLVYYSQNVRSAQLTCHNLKTGETTTFGGKHGAALMGLQNGVLYAAEYGTTGSKIYAYDPKTLQETAQSPVQGIGSNAATPLFFRDGKIYVGTYAFEEGSLIPCFNYVGRIFCVSEEYVLTQRNVYDRKTGTMYKPLDAGGLITNSYGGGMLTDDGSLVQLGGQNLVVWKK